MDSAITVCLPTMEGTVGTRVTEGDIKDEEDIATIREGTAEDIKEGMPLTFLLPTLLHLMFLVPRHWAAWDTAVLPPAGEATRTIPCPDLILPLSLPEERAEGALPIRRITRGRAGISFPVGEGAPRARFLTVLEAAAPWRAEGPEDTAWLQGWEEEATRAQEEVWRARAVPIILLILCHLLSFRVEGDTKVTRAVRGMPRALLAVFRGAMHPELEAVATFQVLFPLLFPLLFPPLPPLPTTTAGTILGVQRQVPMFPPVPTPLRFKRLKVVRLGIMQARHLVVLPCRAFSKRPTILNRRRGKASILQFSGELLILPPVRVA